MASITNIPPELLIAIAEKLPRRKDVFALRQVCGALSEVLAPTSLASVVMDPASPAGLNALKTLAQAAEQQHPVSKWAQKLTIKSFLTEDGEAEALAWMETVCQNLKSTTCLEWLQKRDYRRTDDMLADRVSTAIATFLAPLVPSLERVAIYNFREVHGPLLDGLSRLTSLSLSVIPSFSPHHMHGNSSLKTLDAHTYQSMCGAIQRSSDTLESLKLCITRWEPSSSSSIYELLKDTKSPSFPQLAILHFEICSGDLEKSLNCTLPSLSRHFSSLQVLHLPGYLSGDPLKMPPESDNIFTVLESSCIHLVDIYLKCICRPLLQYLLSYGSTLQRLSIEDAGYRYSNLALAADFNNAISQHKSSLHTLSIRSSWDNGLAFGNNNKELLLLPLPALETLRVPVFVDSGWAQEGDAYLKLCLDRALNSAQFPLLRQLYLDPIVGKPEPVGSGDSGWARGNYITSLMDHAEALRRLCSYQFSSKSVGEAIREDPLPVVLTGGQRTYPIRTKEGWRYRSQTD